LDIYKLKLENKYKSIPTTMKKDTAHIGYFIDPTGSIL